jgi:hypothetical protein
LSQFLQVHASEVQVRRSFPDDFLLLFTTWQVADWVLHAPPPLGGSVVTGVPSLAAAGRVIVLTAMFQSVAIHH